MEAAKRVKEEGKENNLSELIAEDSAFGITLDEIYELLKPEKFVGRSKEQTEEFLEDEVMPILEKFKSDKDDEVEITV